MSSIMSQFALRMFDQSRFKINVIVQDLTLYDSMTVLCVRSLTLEGLMTFLNDLAHMLSSRRRCAERMFYQGHLNVKIKVQV